ncbi:ML5, partial [Symbiodinium sp. CCMP2456]
FPPTPPASLTAAAAAAAAAAFAKEQGTRRTSKKESANQIPEIKKKKAPDVKKGSKESNLSPVGVGAQVKADKVLQPPSGELTTVMLRHIPNRYTSTQLVELLDAKGFQAKYDFVYLPIDFQNKVNLGYCFVNLLSHQWALKFKEEFEGFKAWLFDSIKASEVSW